MKYKELQKIALKSFYDIEKNGFRTIIKKRNLRDGSLNEIIISELDIGVIEISANLMYYCDFNVLRGAVDYSKTPLGEREEKKDILSPYQD